MIRKKIKTHPLCFLLLWMSLYLIGFFVSGHYISPRWKAFVALDARVPFCPEFIIFYVIWFVYFPGFLLYFFVNSKKDYFNLVFVLMTGMTLSVIFYFLFPNYFPGRCEELGNGFFSLLVERIYNSDPPTNAFPSIHAGSSIAVFLVVNNSKFLRNKKYIIIGSFFITMMISLSTLFVKQHSIIDVASGFILNILVYIFFCKTNRGREFVDSLC